MRHSLSIGLASALLLSAAPVSAATWAQGTTPRLTQIFAVDATGEPGWVYGQEDVFGDGLNVFTTAEQQRDLRTAYAAADANRFWARVYVSDTNAIDPAVTVFVFINSDMNTTTGGGTVSADLSAAFTTEKSPGGYEYVLGVAGNGTIANVWSWSTTQTKYVPIPTINASNSAAETGHDVDPIGILTAQHGYVQGNVDLNLVGLTQACNANLYVRSAATSGPSDLDMSFTTTCVPQRNANGVPTILVPPGTCTSNAQCPQNGVCVNGQCVIGVPCATTADCPANYTCGPNGTCVPNGGGTCTTQANCSNGLACVNGTCTGCTQTSQCAAGYVCAPNGTCVQGTGGDGGVGGGHIEGGAFHCAMSRGRGEWIVLALVGIALIAARARRRK